MGICKAENFFNEIIKMKKVFLIEDACKKEYDYLKNSYNTIASLKTGFSNYRNYLKQVLSYEYCVEGQSVLKILLNIFRLNNQEQLEYNKKKQRQIVNERSNLRAITDVDKYLNISIQLLTSSSYYDKILGLCALTGRRTAEIACSANMVYIDQENVLFSGQLKLKSRELKAYKIPVLYDSKVLIETLNSLHKQKPEFINNPPKFHTVAASDLSKKIKKIYVGCFEGTVRPKDLRAIYVELAHALFCKDRKIAKQQYYSDILGHNKDDAAISEAYVDFYIDDKNFV